MIQATICELHYRMSNADMMNRALHNRVSTLETQLEHATGGIGDYKKLTDGEMFLILLRVSRIYRLVFTSYAYYCLLGRNITL
jgi:hypothetical protein